MKTSYYLILLIVLSLILGKVSSLLLGMDSLLEEALYSNFGFDQVKSFLAQRSKFSWLEYIVVPLFILIRVVIPYLLLDMSLFLFNSKIKKNKLFKIVVISEFIFLFVIITKTLWFYFFVSDYTLEDLQYFYPLSALNLVGYEGLDPWWIYPLQVLNLFELTYWFVLAYLIGIEIRDTVSTIGLQIVASSYGVGLFIWVICVMFLTLNLS